MYFHLRIAQALTTLRRNMRNCIDGQRVYLLPPAGERERARPKAARSAGRATTGTNSAFGSQYRLGLARWSINVRPHPREFGSANQYPPIYDIGKLGRSQAPIAMRPQNSAFVFTSSCSRPHGRLAAMARSKRASSHRSIRYPGLFAMANTKREARLNAGRKKCRR
jgi:hypothetical protein